MPTSRTPHALTDEAALRHVPERTTNAWASHDASAFADAFTEDTKVVIAGTYLQGRDRVRSYMSAAFSGPVGSGNELLEAVGRIRARHARRTPCGTLTAGRARAG